MILDLNIHKLYSTTPRYILIEFGVLGAVNDAIRMAAVCGTLRVFLQCDERYKGV